MILLNARFQMFIIQINLNANAAENYAKVNNILFNVITEYDIFKIIKNNNFLYDYIESQDLSYKDKVLKSYKNFMKEA